MAPADVIILAKCPGCGKAPKFAVKVLDPGSRSHWVNVHWVECSCGWIGPNAIAETEVEEFKAKLKAAALWNKRA